MGIVIKRTKKVKPEAKLLKNAAKSGDIFKKNGRTFMVLTDGAYVNALRSSGQYPTVVVDLNDGVVTRFADFAKVEKLYDGEITLIERAGQ